jgi:hypothetical protein
MTGMLSQLRGMGYEVRAEGEEVVCRWQGLGAPDEQARSLLAQLSQLKGEVLALLRAEADQPPVDPAGPCPPWPFAIRSCILDVEVWIVPDGWVEPVPGLAYTHAEIRALDRQRPTPEALKAVHQVKAHFDGEVLR